MFDILVYLFEHFFDTGNHPDSATLMRKLTLAGFDNEEITQTLNWLSTIEQYEVDDYPASLTENKSFRCYAAFELEHIDAEGIGFIMFLEQEGILDPLQRELLIDQVLTMDENTPSQEKIKLLVLTQLWMKNKLTDQTVIEKLMLSNDTCYLH